MLKFSMAFTYLGALCASGAFLPTIVFANANGSELFRTQCAQCHALTEQVDALVGPSLENIVGRPAAQMVNYSYSDALTQKAAAGLVWDATTLAQFLLSPGGAVPGTTMGFSGMTSAADRDTLVAWLANRDAISAGSESTPGEAIRNPDVDRIVSLSADPDYGEYLAAECVTCHAVDSASGGVPPIHKLPKPYFIQALLEYKNGDRVNSIMQLVTNNLGDEELAALATFFSADK